MYLRINKTCQVKKNKYYEWNNSQFANKRFWLKVNNFKWVKHLLGKLIEVILRGLLSILKFVIRIISHLTHKMVDSVQLRIFQVLCLSWANFFSMIIMDPWPRVLQTAVIMTTITFSMNNLQIKNATAWSTNNYGATGNHR